MVDFCLEGPIARSDVPGIVARLSARLEHGEAAIVVCRLRGVDASAASLDALARLQLVARRHGGRVTLMGASGALRELIAYAGLQDVLPV
ncbi:MAG TPA: STAS domain-containing protein [Solirubrobacteraceae bacterium]